MNNKKAVMIIIAMGLVIFLAGLHALEFMKINCRFALFVADMRLHGIGIFPTMHGKPYTDYPSTMTILMYLASFGGRYVNMLTMTLPSALAGALTLVITYLIGARVSKWLGGYAVMLSLMSFEFLSICREPSLDIFVAAAAATAFYTAYTADLDKRWKRLLWIPLCLALGFAIRGPLGMIIPAAVVFSYYLVNLKWKMCVITALVSGALFAACMGALIFACYLQGGHKLMDLFFYDQILQRMESGKPLWYYFTNAVGSYAITYPAALIVLAFYVKKLFRKPTPEDSQELKLMRSLAAWMFIVLIGMSIPGTKHLRYVVAIIPAAGLLFGWVFMNFDKLKIFEQLKKLLFLICRIMPFAAFAVLVIATIVLKIIGLNIGLPLFIPSLIFIILGFTVIALSKGVNPQQRDFVLVAIAVATFAVIRVMIIDPIEQYVESSRSFVAKVEQFRGNNEVWFFHLGPDGDEHKYQINIPPKRRFVSKFIFLPPGPPPQQPTKPPALKPAPAPQIIISRPTKDTSLRERMTIAVIDWISSLFPPDGDAKYPQLRPMFKIYNGFTTLEQLPPGTILITRKNRYYRNMPKELQSKYEIIVRGKMGHKQCVAFRRKTKAKDKHNK